MVDAFDIADAIVTGLNYRDGQNHGLFTVPFTAVMTVLPMYELKDLESVKVTVMPKKVDIEPASRAADQYDFEIDIAVQQKLDAPIDASVATLAGLVNEIAAYFRKRIYSSLGAVWVGTKIDPIFSIEHIQPPSVFTSVISVVFRVVQ